MTTLRLTGSCHCGAVGFTVDSETPVPYQRCYCSICRKTAGGGGFAINIMGVADTLEVTGEQHVSLYRVEASRTQSGHGEADGRSTARRFFCGQCGSALWLYDPNWPQWVYPFASAIDTELPPTPRLTHIMLDFKPAWVPVPESADDTYCRFYPDQSIAAWHAALDE